MTASFRRLAAIAMASATLLIVTVAPVGATGAVQVRGMAEFDWSISLGVPPDSESTCPAPGGDFAAHTDFTLAFAGDLQGCWYTFIEEIKVQPSGTYRERGREVFIGTYLGQAGTFQTNYQFEGKFEESGAEVHGRCQHRITAESGTGAFDGVSGRIDIKDDVETGCYFYRGHLHWDS
jgi:hypothetical protein